MSKKYVYIVLVILVIVAISLLIGMYGDLVKTTIHRTSSGLITQKLSLKTDNLDPGTYTLKFVGNWMNGNVRHSKEFIVEQPGVTPTPTPVAGNRDPIAVVKLGINGGAFANEITVTKGVPVQLRMSAEGSTDPDGWSTAGKGIATGGKCEWDKDLNYSTLEHSIANPATPGACELNLGSFTFDIPAGRYPYDILRITDAAGVQSNIARAYVNVVAPGASITPTPTPAVTPIVTVTPTPTVTPIVTATPTPTPTANQSPVAVVKLGINGGAFANEITVTKGVPVQLRMSAEGSSDSDGWATAGKGIATGGKCEWDKDLNYSTLEHSIPNPANPGACELNLGSFTFDIPVGRYPYDILRITDASGAQSNIARAYVTVVAP